MEAVSLKSPFSIPNLPRELLAQILSSSSSFLVIPLYLAGDKTLNHKLETGGCLEVRLEDRKMDSKSCFPSLLKNLLHLRRLSIIKYGTLLSLFRSLKSATRAQSLHTKARN